MENDVNLTKDGWLIAVEDNCRDRVTNKSGLIRDWTVNEIKKAKKGGSEEIHLISELLNSGTDSIFNSDCRVDETVKPLINLLKKREILNRVCSWWLSRNRINFIRRSLGNAINT